MDERVQRRLARDKIRATISRPSGKLEICWDVFHTGRCSQDVSTPHARGRLLARLVWGSYHQRRNEPLLGTPYNGSLTIFYSTLTKWRCTDYPRAMAQAPFAWLQACSP
jgi:hypothetical protein